jgi:Tyrosine-protein kinase ephrin type A/B receptor-like
MATSFKFFLVLGLVFLTLADAAEDTCSLCEQNHYCSSKNMTACPAHSSSPYGSDAINDCVCDAGYFGPNGGACPSCVADSFCVGGAATESCPEHAASPVGSDAAVDCICNAGWYGDPGGPCTQCEVGSWCYAGVKAVCPVNTSSAWGSDEQVDCKCLAGYTGADGFACAPCVAGTYKTDAGSDVCTSCGGGTYSTTAAATTSATCLSCPSNTFSLVRSDELIDCKCLAGHSADEDGAECTACAAGTYKASTGTGTCISCETDTYSTDTAATTAATCLGCPAHTSAPEGSDALVDCKCVVGYTATENGVQCVACGKGTYKVAIGTGTCTSCQANTYSITTAAFSGDTCTSCPEHTFSASNSIELSNCSCVFGYIGNDGTACTACAAVSVQHVKIIHTLQQRRRRRIVRAYSVQ